MTGSSLAERAAALEWYHTIELPDGTVTLGFFDHRGVIDRYALPDRLDGMRVLDCGTFDGYFAFEFERRGAKEVVALDVPDTESLDWPAPLRRKGTTRFQPQHENFDLAREALSSTVDRRFVSVYNVDPDELGQFDLVFIGSLLGHLRDPVGALMALRSVCAGRLHLAEMTHRRLDLLSRRVGVAKFQALSANMTWWVPNRKCLEEMVWAAGFDDVTVGDTFTVPFREQRGGIRHTVVTAGRGPD
jgi:tRNA (mo5U34)-methyltransferase